MNETVWISTAPGHASNLRPFRHDVDDRGREIFQPILDRIDAGEPIALEDFPKTIYGAPEAQEKDYQLPDLFRAYGFWVVSGAAADVISQYDLGEGALQPVQVQKKDRRTPVDGNWLCMSIGNRKDALLPEESSRMTHDFILKGRMGWFPPFVPKDDDIALSSAACAGPDIWIDLQVGTSFFLSDRLARGLKKAKADRGFFLSRCRVLDI
jgi:hypothetical protein